jgi:hypothetical protein
MELKVIDPNTAVLQIVERDFKGLYSGGITRMVLSTEKF